MSALELSATGTAEYWMARLEAVNDGNILTVVQAAPNEKMSDVTRSFIVELLTKTKRRLLDGYAGTCTGKS